ncbi:hypothetical protein BHE74_00007565, partial [Ensete ventricosum]
KTFVGSSVVQVFNGLVLLAEVIDRYASTIWAIWVLVFMRIMAVRCLLISIPIRVGRQFCVPNFVYA